jgi:hypothetical protein
VYVRRSPLLPMLRPLSGRRAQTADHEYAGADLIRPFDGAGRKMPSARIELARAV